MVTFHRETLIPTVHTSPFPIINVTVDAVVLRQVSQRPDAAYEVLCIRRGGQPFKGMLALPGGFINPDEDAVTACRRELREETGLDFERGWRSLPAATAPGRDPRNRTISLPFLRVLHYDTDGWAVPVAGDDAAEVGWFPVMPLLPGSAWSSLAFDHSEILQSALRQVGRL